MGIRTVKNELEAKLTAKSGFFSKPSGKVERKSYADCTERLRITLRKIKSPHNTVAVVKADGKEVALIPLVDGGGKFDNESTNTGEIPDLKVGQTITVEIDGKLALSGKLHTD